MELHPYPEKGLFSLGETVKMSAKPEKSLSVLMFYNRIISIRFSIV